MKDKRRVKGQMLAAMVFLATAIIASAQTSGNIAKWVVQKNSTLEVAGKTNVNSFTCNISQYNEKDTIAFFGESNKTIKLNGDLTMDILSFDCHSSMVNKDMQKTLKADEYPKLKIRFLTLQNMPLLQQKSEQVKGWLEVELAGVIKRIEMIYTISKAGNNFIQMSGNRNFTFSDFNLSPPQKFAGLIKIRDEFNVNFQLVLRAL
jgi:hypothetical protein